MRKSINLIGKQKLPDRLRIAIKIVIDSLLLYTLNNKSFLQQI